MSEEKSKKGRQHAPFFLCLKNCSRFSLTKSGIACYLPLSRCIFLFIHLTPNHFRHVCWCVLSSGSELGGSWQALQSDLGDRKVPKGFEGKEAPGSEARAEAAKATSATAKATAGAAAVAIAAATRAAPTATAAARATLPLLPLFLLFFFDTVNFIDFFFLLLNHHYPPSFCAHRRPSPTATARARD